MRRNTEAFIASLCDSMTEGLAKYSFFRESEKLRLIDGTEIRWSRLTGWKSEVVRVVFPNKFVENVDIGLDVELLLPCSKKILLDGRTVDYISGRKKGTYYFPVFSVFDRSFIEKLVDDTIKSLNWFNDYRTSRDCLARLVNDETNMGQLKAEGATRLAFDYLKSLENTV
jgi:hypothetical protein